MSCELFQPFVEEFFDFDTIFEFDANTSSVSSSSAYASEDSDYSDYVQENYTPTLEKLYTFERKLEALGRSVDSLGTDVNKTMTSSNYSNPQYARELEGLMNQLTILDLKITQQLDQVERAIDSIKNINRNDLEGNLKNLTQTKLNGVDRNINTYLGEYKEIEREYKKMQRENTVA